MRYLPFTMRVVRADNTRTLPYVAAVIALITGGVVLGTGLSSLLQSRALVGELRAHGAVATATVTNWPPDQAGSPQAAFGFKLPGGTIALTADTQFDGTFSVPPPKGNATLSVVVRYDPANVDAVLPESIVRHPSYHRVTVRSAVGAGAVMVALAFGIWWWRRQRRWRAARTTLFRTAFMSDVLSNAEPPATPGQG